MNISLLTAYSLTVLALIATPGPVVVLVTGAAAREGFASAVRTMIGGNLASLVLLAAAAAMLNGIVALDPRALTLMATIGSLFIIRLALGMLRAEPVTQDASKKRSGVMAGFATALSNPKDILFFCRVFSAVYFCNRQLRFEPGAPDGGMGDDRLRRAYALYSGGSSLVNGALRPAINNGVGVFPPNSGALRPGLQPLAAKSSVEEKTAGDQRADNQQDQDELKTIAPQHSALRKKTALKPAPVLYQSISPGRLSSRLGSSFSGMVPGGFVVLFRSLGFLSYRFSGGLFVFFGGLSLLGGSRFSFCFLVLFSRLRFLLCSRFNSGFMVFLVMGRFSGGAVSCSSRSRSGGGGGIGSESDRRQTHSSGNDQS